MTSAKLVALTGISALIVVSSATGCGRQSPEEGWQAVVTTEVAAKPGQGGLATFLGSVEAADLERREQGLSFWNRHPDDVRRYEWLMLTVHAAPHYAADISDWARAEAGHPGRNNAAIDLERQTEWDKLYPSLREVFWSAPSTTDWDRRFLWSGEIVSRYDRIRDAKARGEAIDINAANAALIAFLQTYKKAENDDDIPSFTSALYAVVDAGLIATEEVEGERARAALVQRIESIGSEPATLWAKGLQEKLVETPDRKEPWFIAIEGPKSFTPDQTPVGKVASRREELIRRHIQREKGLELWTSMPAAARLNWMTSTLKAPPEFTVRLENAIWSPAEHNESPDAAASAASDRAIAALETTYLNDPATTFEERSTLAGVHLQIRAQELTHRLPARDEGAIEVFMRDLRAYNAQYGHAHPLDYALLSTVLQDYPRWGVTHQQAQIAFAPLLRSSLSTARSYARSIQTRIDAQSTPFDFRGTTIDGEPFDVASLRGKIVLVDHWSTTCSSCIAAMPRINEIYKRYRSRGFEVLSIAYNQRSDERLVRRIEHEKGLTWTTLIAGDQWRAVSEKYGYSGVPQYMLLRRDGTLYAGTGEVDLGRGLEALLDQMLAEEASAKKTRP